MTPTEAIAVQHEGWPHAAQPCLVGDFPCDVQTLLGEIATLRDDIEAANRLDTRRAATIATLSAALEGAVAELEKPTELHDYRGGFHRSPDCPGCMMLARLRAALATAKGTGGPTLPPPDLDLIENSDGNGNRWPEATP